MLEILISFNLQCWAWNSWTCTHYASSVALWSTSCSGEFYFTMVLKERFGRYLLWRVWHKGTNPTFQDSIFWIDFQRPTHLKMRQYKTFCVLVIWENTLLQFKRTFSFHLDTIQISTTNTLVRSIFIVHWFCPFSLYLICFNQFTL